MILAGIIILGYGSNIFINSAIGIARIFNVPNIVISVSLVAFGTSIPELSATLSAITYPEINSVSIALGNIIGSNIANILLILGLISIFVDIEFSSKTKKKNETVW